MEDLDKLAEESLEETIKFPFPITEEGIEGEGKLFDYLKGKLPCDITYGCIKGKSFFAGNIIKCAGAHITTNLRFKIDAESIRFESLEEGYSGSEKSFIDEIRQKTGEYFLS